VKLAFLSSIYLKHLGQIYKRLNGLEDKSYLEQNKIIRDETISSMGEWQKHFTKSGTETLMVCINNPFSQSRWCRENDFIPKGNDLEFEIALEQLRRFRPTHVFIFGISYYSENNRLNKIINECSTLKKKICWYGAPEGNLNEFKNYDLVITPSSELNKDLQSNGINSAVLNHAFEPRTLELIKSNPRRNKLCFIGSLTLGNNWHEERFRYLELLCKEIEVDIYADINKPSFLQNIKRHLINYRQNICEVITNYEKTIEKFKYYADKENLPIYDRFHNSPITDKIKPPEYGLRMMNILSSYTLTFNMHIPIAKDWACNMRLTEASGIGTCLLSDHKRNNKEYFAQYEQYCTYKSVNDFLKKYNYLHANSNLIDEISNELQCLTLKNRNTTIQFNNLQKILKRL
jgi:spore maturation protein CgeB